MLLSGPEEQMIHGMSRLAVKKVAQLWRQTSGLCVASSRAHLNQPTVKRPHQRRPTLTLSEDKIIS